MKNNKIKSIIFKNYTYDFSVVRMSYQECMVFMVLLWDDFTKSQSKGYPFLSNINVNASSITLQA